MPGQLLLKLADGSVVPVSGLQGPPGPAGPAGGVSLRHPLAVQASGFKYPFIPGVAGSGAGTKAMTSIQLHYHPIYCYDDIIVNEMLVTVTTGTTGTARLGIYEANDSWQPVGAPKVSGDVTVTATGQYKVTGLSVPLTAGVPYLLSLQVSANLSFAVMRGYLPQFSLATSFSSTLMLVMDIFKSSWTFQANPSSGHEWTGHNGGTTPFNYPIALIGTLA